MTDKSLSIIPMRIIILPKILIITIIILIIITIRPIIMVTITLNFWIKHI